MGTDAPASRKRKSKKKAQTGNVCLSMISLQIPTSGPFYKMPRAGLVVPPHPGGKTGGASTGARRHSVISSSKEITSFPLKAGGGHRNGSMGGSGDIRRPSEVWFGKKKGSAKIPGQS